MSVGLHSDGATRRLPSLAAAALVAALPLLLFWRLLTPIAADRANIAEGDLSSQYLPLRVYAASRLAQGELPLWSPNVFAGQPALADIQTAVLYPPNLVWSLVRGEDLGLLDLEWQAVLHLSLAALGAYFLGRRLSGSTVGGVVTGAAFGLGGYLTSFPLQQLTIVCTVAWLPWLLLAVDRGLAGEATAGRTTAGVAALTALTLLAGHPQSAMLCAYAAAGYLAWVWYWRRPPPGRVIAAAGGAALGLGLAAAQLLPTVEFIRLSVRSSLGFGASGGGFGLHELSGLLYPGYFGGTPQYAGIVTLLLALWATATLAWRRTGYWLSLGLAGVLFSFGDSTFLGALTYLLLPGFSTSRNQERAVLWLALSLAVLAGMGVAHLAAQTAPADEDRAAAQGRRLLLWALLAAAVVAGLLLGGTRLPAAEGDVNLFGGFLKQHLWLMAGVGLTLLWWHWRAQGRVSSRWFVAALTALLILNLAAVNGLYHIGEASPAVEQPSAATAAELRSRLEPGQRVASGGILPEGPNAGLLYGFADTTGNTPLRLQSLAQFQENVPEWVQWQLLAVSYVLLPADVEAGQEMALVQSGDASLYALTDPASPLRLVHRLETADGDGVWAALAADQFDPASAAVVPSQATIAVEAAQGQDSVGALVWEPERVSAEVTAGSSALAVFSLVSYPGWSATVDGKAVDNVLTDGLLVGVPVPTGSHTIVLQYRPLSFYAGVAVSLLSLVVTVAVAARPRLLRRLESEP